MNDDLLGNPFDEELRAITKPFGALLPYEVKLFMFLDRDGVPWNNNHDKNAIQPFALCRARVPGMMRAENDAEP